MVRGFGWSQQDIEYLEDNYGQVSMKHLMEKLDRSESAITNKVSRLGLGRWYHNLDEVTLHELALGISTDYKSLVRWAERYGFPIRKKRLKKHYIRVVRIDEFWKWAEKNKNMIEWSKFEPRILGAEPDWVTVARNAATKSNDKSVKKIAWSKDEDEKLLWMLKQHKYTYPQIAEELSRTHGAVKRRISDLGIKLRPLYLDNHRKYTDQEIKNIISMYKDGHSFKTIAAKFGRSEAGVRGKIERMGYTFDNRVLQKK